MGYRLFRRPPIFLLVVFVCLCVWVCGFVDVRVCWCVGLLVSGFGVCGFVCLCVCGLWVCGLLGLCV